MQQFISERIYRLRCKSNTKKGHELKSRQDFTDKSLNAAFISIYANFLTPKEMKEIIDGRDLWLTPDEVRERWLVKISASKPKGTTQKGQ